MIAGTDIVRQSLSHMSDGTGVYRMVNSKGDVLYVGKAKSLRNRLASYTRLHGHTRRIQRMISQIARVDVTITNNEAEALLLESNLIKKMKPPYNVLLRDDKSFPYIMITTDHPWPRLLKHRGARDKAAAYYGPFAAVNAVGHTMRTIERAFLLRTCSDNVFANRTRPCLLYQIKRCAAPCVGYVTRNDYGQLVNQARRCLEGHDQDILDSLTRLMHKASAKQDYEAALTYRDRIRALGQLRKFRGISVPALGNSDVIALHQAEGKSCVQVFFFRGGRNYGNRAYFPRHDPSIPEHEVLSAFIGQFYAARPAAGTIVLSHRIAGTALIEEALTTRANHKVRLIVPQRGARHTALLGALNNAREALKRRISEDQADMALLERVGACFGLDTPPQRIEVYDNSHIQGRHSLGVMIVAGPGGFNRSAYRTFNARSANRQTGDDYALLREVLTRRFLRLLKSPDKDDWPDLLLIDGGAGHLSTTLTVLAELGVENVAVATIAKGRQRNAGRERFYVPDRASFTLGARDPVLHYLQRLRDEAHRFAITGHRLRREKAMHRSLLDDIAGIGPHRKRALMLHLGSAQGVQEATLKELQAVPGISQSLARIIHNHFHETDPAPVDIKHKSPSG